MNRIKCSDSLSRQHKATTLQRAAEAAANPTRSRRGSRAEQRASIRLARRHPPSFPTEWKSERHSTRGKRGVYSRARPRRGRSCARTWRRGGGSRTRSRVWAPGAGQGEAAASPSPPRSARWGARGVAEVAAVDRTAGWRGVGARAPVREGVEGEKERQAEE